MRNTHRANALRTIKDYIQNRVAPVPNELAKKRVWEVYENKCVYCDSTFQLGIEHLISRGEITQLDGFYLLHQLRNLAIACGPCNNSRNSGSAEAIPWYEQKKLMELPREDYEARCQWIQDRQDMLSPPEDGPIYSQDVIEQFKWMQIVTELWNREALKFDKTMASYHNRQPRP